MLENKCGLQLLPAYVCAEVLGWTHRREGTLIPMLEKAEVPPCAVGPLPLTGVNPSVHGLANPAGTIGTSISKRRREHFSWLPCEF